MNNIQNILLKMILTYAVIICDMFENCKERCFAKRNTFCSNHINDMQNRRKGCILSMNEDIRIYTYIVIIFQIICLLPLKPS